MNSTWLIILGVLAAGLAVFLLLPTVLPERAPDVEDPAVMDIEPEVVAEAEDAAPETAEPEPEDEATETEQETAETAEDVTPEEVTARVTGYSIDGVIGATEYAHHSEVAGVEIHWSNDATYLRMGLVAPGTGYVSIGFDPVRRMEGANYVIGYVQDGKGYFRDDFGTEPTAHMADVDRGGQDNIISSAGAEWADQTILEFIIPLDSGDEMDKPLVPGNTYTVLLAYHDLQDGFVARHSRRGSGEIQLDTVP